MTRSQSENWSMTRSLAFLAATFAIVIGSLMPFAAMAAAQPGQPIVICSAEGLQTIQTGGLDGPIKQQVGAKCAACVMPLLAALPAPAPPQPAPVLRLAEAVVYAPFVAAPPPPARAPPRPPSRAPPHA
ncbi:DUF2946 domain-containing protein [Brevundimonas naejangsanensis]|uniref:DUF2946 domain-containing protein n=1 Tax=Brevundimonas naejangsanensis TaxID=588932 RepID=A0A494RIN5_9CAUL|nr:DUF2946 family protein [Brevundimonas naejangsanensis]AYG93842.1 DUF2946 domain-containing protein [Brevundimonas naejangsanensis]